MSFLIDVYSFYRFHCIKVVLSIDIYTDEVDEYGQD